jgi:hypothetical protein
LRAPAAQARLGARNRVAGRRPFGAPRAQQPKPAARMRNGLLMSLAPAAAAASAAAAGGERAPPRASRFVFVSDTTDWLERPRKRQRVKAADDQAPARRARLDGLVALLEGRR